MAYYPLKVKDGAGTVHTVGDPRINTADAIPQSSINGLDTALAGKVDTTDSRLSDQRVPTNNSVTSAKIVDGSIVNADINASAAIALSKLATGALPSGITVASANIVNGTIVDADINASAAIAQSKISGLTTALAAKLNSAGGKILQVVSATGTQAATTSTSFVDAGLSVAITPSSTSSKVLVFVTTNVLVTTGTGGVTGGTHQILRGSTVIHLPNTPSTYSQANNANGMVLFYSAALSCSDSPATTSATTYKIQHKAHSGATLTTNANNAATITVMEISA